jgi:ribonuclease H2 subunit C
MAEASADADGAGEVHHLPCKIKFTGPARVSTFFVVSQASAAGSETRCSFRGRRLVGTRVPMPEGTRGFVLRKRAAAPSEPETPAENRWQADAFASLTWWGADFPAVPTAMHTVAAWMETAAALHDEPVLADAAAPEPQAIAT